MPDGGHVRLLLIGRTGGELGLAAAMAREAGAAVQTVDGTDAAIAVLRATAMGLAMIDVELDVEGFMARLRAERFHLPVIGCGINAPAARAVAAIRAGARDYVPLPPERALIAAALACAASVPSARIVGEDPALQRALTFARAIAASRMPVLVAGERGTGKETVARAIHAASGRTGRFLTIECAGVAPEIIDAELFGHEPARLDAGRRIGRLEQAQGGTLLVRDIEWLPAAAQARLIDALRAADDVRLIAASTADLAARVAAGGFRADLLARLAAAEVRLPPLRARPGDIPLLARHFAARQDQPHGLTPRAIDARAMALLVAHTWPGNVGELEGVVQRALAIAEGPEIAPDDVVLSDGSQIASPHAAPGDAEVTGLVGRTVEEVERALILRTLERCRGNRTSASGILGISVRTMRNKLRSFAEAGITVAPAA